MQESSRGIQAKKTLLSFVEQINEKLEVLWAQEKNKNFGFNDRQRTMVRELLDHAHEHNMRKSKRIRGAFTCYAYALGGRPIDETIWNAAMGVELVQTALLIHDDFMDRDVVRRGKPTTHEWYKSRYGASEHFGASMAINVGDAILDVGFDLLASTGNIAATRKMLRGIAETAYGQAYDVALTEMGHWTEDDVITLHKAKTAIYTYENPLYIGAHLANLPDEVFQILHDYSMDGGVAFQLQDDILGIFGESEETGKSADSDILQGKCTLLVLKVWDSGSATQQEALKRVWGKLSASREDLEAAKQAIIDSGSLDYNRRLARELAEKAAHAAEKLRSLQLDGEAIDFIQGVAEYMVTRKV